MIYYMQGWASFSFLWWLKHKLCHQNEVTEKPIMRILFLKKNPTKSVYQLHVLRKDFQKSEQKIPTTPMTSLYYRLLKWLFFLIKKGNLLDLWNSRSRFLHYDPVSHEELPLNFQTELLDCCFNFLLGIVVSHVLCAVTINSYNDVTRTQIRLWSFTSWCYLKENQSKFLCNCLRGICPFIESVCLLACLDMFLQGRNYTINVSAINTSLFHYSNSFILKRFR